ncbi:MAG: hypothetical protein IJU50_08305, partial [Lachnospiraceae bacterium]|nr:hypothetical protein [Lachnospiraceae bacterium]
TSNYFFVADIGDALYYLPATALTLEPGGGGASGTSTPAASAYVPLIALPSRDVTAANASDALTQTQLAIQDRVQRLTISVPSPLCGDIYQAIYTHLSGLANAQIAKYNQADLRSMEVGYRSGSSAYVYVNFSYGSAPHDAEVDQVVSAKYAEFAALPNDYEKVLAVHDWLCGLVDYREDAYDCHTAYGALVRHQAVCDGYALSFQRFMDALGIPCYVATGIRNNEAHAWNLVQLNGQWYHLDTTWDDQSRGLIRDYFLISGPQAGYLSWGNITLAPSNYR